MPPLYTPVWSIQAIIILIPAFFVTLVELIGHLQVTGNIVGTDMFKDHGLFRVLVGKGISCTLSGFFGSTPNTTYSENICVIEITRVYSTAIFAGAAVCAILISLLWQVLLCYYEYPGSGYRRNIPSALWRHRCSGNTDAHRNTRGSLTDKKYGSRLSHLRNRMFRAVVNLRPSKIDGMSLATIVGIGLNLLFIGFSKLGIINEEKVDSPS